MAPAHRTQRTQRTKTFTGCWTCRERKVKCDEAEPRCQQCRRRGWTCGGYSTRLQWLPPSLPHTRLTSPDRAASAEKGPSALLRRVLPPEHHRHVLRPHELDDIFKSIDTVDPDQLPEGGSKNFHNFSILRCTLPEQPRPQSCDSPPSHTASHQDCSVAERGVRGEHTLASTASPSVGSASIAGPSNSCPSFDSLDTETADDSYTRDSDNLELADDKPTISSSLLPCEYGGGPHDDSSLEWTAHGLQSVDWLHSHNVSTDHTSLEPTTAQDRFLMRHYAQRVCHLFCAIDTPKSPWRTIHLPRALQAMGELSVTGTTSRIRNALLKVLLAVSACYMSNDHRRHHGNDQADRWAQAAAEYKSDAITLLKQAVERDLYSAPRPKYKDFLATMLSMITVNVMSGSATTCGVHLNGAHQLLEHMWNEKKKASEKTKTLHRIYCYLRIIWESTQVFKDGRAECVMRSSPRKSVFKMLEQREAAEDSFSNASETSCGLLTMPSFEHIYGIPQSLLAMLEDTTRVVDQLKRTNKANDEDLGGACSELEQRILDWALVSDSNCDPSTSEGKRQKIIQHQTASFHSALVIFFSQNVRSLDRRYLKQYIETVLESIEAIERIKAETNMLAAPLFWPAFMAATTAYTSDHRTRFRKWYEGASSYGIATVRTGINVILKVWENDQPPTGSLTCPWRHVVSSSGEDLMLS